MFGKIWELPGLYLRPDEGAGSGTGNGDNAGSENEQGAGDETGDATGQANGGEQIDFTPAQQEHINKIVADRLARDRAAQAKKAEAAKAAEADEAEKARLKEQQEWKALAEKHEGAVSKAQAERDEARAQLSEERFAREVERAASELHFRSVDDALKQIDMTLVSQDDSGAWVGIKEALTKLAAEKDYLIEKEETTGRQGTPKRNRQLPRRGNAHGEETRRATTIGITL